MAFKGPQHLLDGIESSGGCSNRQELFKFPASVPVQSHRIKGDKSSGWFAAVEVGSPRSAASDG